MNPTLPLRARFLKAPLLAASLALIFLTSSSADAQTFNTGGTVAWYDAGDGSGTACQMGPTPIATAPFGLTAAISEADWNGSEACGQFIEIRTTASSCAGISPSCPFNELLTGDPVVVQINDLCPIATCPSGRFELNAAAFDTLAPTSVGLISDVEWRPVYGLFPGNVQIRNGTGGNPFFALLTPTDHNVPISTVEVTDAALGVWIELTRSYVNSFEGAIPPPYLTLPVSVRLTSTTGEVIVGTDVITSFTSGDTFDVGSQFSPPAPSVPIPVTVPLAIGLGALWLGRRWSLPGWTSSTRN